MASSSLVRYLLVGALNTVVGLGTIYLAMYAFGWGAVSANLAGYAVGILCSFALNRRWTFASEAAPVPAFVRFVLVMASAYLLNLATVVALIDLMQVNRYLAQALGNVPYTVAGYLGSRYLVFARAGQWGATSAP